MATNDQEFPCAGPIEATVRIGGGSINVIAEDRSTVAVSVDGYGLGDNSRTAAQLTEVSFADGRLRVEAPRGASWLLRRSGRIRVTLRVPRDSRLQTNVGSADVTTEGRLGEVVVHSGSGDARIAWAGSLRADTGSGDVRADQLGALQASTASGDVSVNRVTGVAVVRTASGDVVIEDGGESVQATTSSGDIRIASVHGSAVNLTSSSGDAVVGVPRGTRVWLDLGSISGTARSDLEMTAQPTDDTPCLTVAVRTTSGDISVRRVAA